MYRDSALLKTAFTVPPDLIHICSRCALHGLCGGRQRICHRPFSTNRRKSGLARAGPAQRKLPELFQAAQRPFRGKPPDLQFPGRPDSVRRCENHCPSFPRPKWRCPFVSNASEQAHDVHFSPVQRLISLMG